MFAVETKNLTKKYKKGVLAVDKLDLKIKKGEIFGLLGPNGAGKTTTLMMLTTLRPPSFGTAKISGFNIVKEPDKVRKSIGIVFQDPSSDEILTGYENLKLHGLLYDMPKEVMEKRISEVLKLVDLEKRRNDNVKKYSGGMRRRLELARGLMHRPKILFMDEPTLGLDPQSREKIWQYVEKLAKENDMTIIITTHYMDEADRLCDRLAIIDAGKIVVLDSPKKLKKKLGGDIIKIRTKKPNLAMLKKLKYVKKIQRCECEYCLTVKDASAHLQEILRAAGKVDSVEVHSPTLDDVFLHYTGRAIREDTPEGGWGEKAMNMRTKK